jgi:hypothetical protein
MKDRKLTTEVLIVNEARREALDWLSKPSSTLPMPATGALEPVADLAEIFEEHREQIDPGVLRHPPKAVKQAVRSWADELDGGPWLVQAGLLTLIHWSDTIGHPIEDGLWGSTRTGARHFSMMWHSSEPLEEFVKRAKAELASEGWRLSGKAGWATMKPSHVWALLARGLRVGDVAKHYEVTPAAVRKARQRARELLNSKV